MRKTAIAIIDLVIGAAIAIPIIAVPWALLGGDQKALWVIVLVFLGTVAAELNDIAGSIKSSRYRMTKRRIAVRSRNGYAARWNIFRWVSGEYRDVFLEKLPRFWFRIASWSLLAAAGLLLVSISSSCETDTEDASQPASIVVETPVPTATGPPATIIPTSTHTRPPTPTPAPPPTGVPTPTAVPTATPVPMMFND